MFYYIKPQTIMCLILYRTKWTPYLMEERFVMLYIYDVIYIYIYIYIPLFCPGRVLMVDIFIIFRVQHYFRVQILAFSGQ